MKNKIATVAVLLMLAGFTNLSYADEILANNCVLTVDYEKVQQYLVTEEENVRGERIKLGSVGENNDGSWYARIENVGRANQRFFNPRDAAQYICEYVSEQKKR